MSPNKPDFELQIANVLRQLGDREITLEAARSMLGSILKSVSDCGVEVDHPSLWQPRGDLLSNAERADFLGSLQNNGTYPVSRQAQRQEVRLQEVRRQEVRRQAPWPLGKGWTTQIEFVRQNDPNSVCFEVTIDCITSDNSRAVLEIAQSAMSHQPPKDRNHDSQLPTDEAQLAFSLVPETNTSQKTEILQRAHLVVFRIRDRFPLDALVTRLPWPPPTALMRQWNEDLEKLSTWFHDNQLPLPSLTWGDLWVTRDGKLTLPTWPVNVAEAILGATGDNDFSAGLSLADRGLPPVDLQSPSSDDPPGTRSLLALRDEIFFAAKVSTDPESIRPNQSPIDFAPTVARSKPEIGSTAGTVTEGVRRQPASKHRWFIAACLASVAIVLMVAAWGMKDGSSVPEVEAAAEAYADNARSHSKATGKTPETQRIANKPLFDNPTDTSLQERLSIAYPETLAPDLAANVARDSSEFLTESSDISDVDTLTSTMPLVDPAFFKDITTQDIHSSGLESPEGVVRDNLNETQSLNARTQASSSNGNAHGNSEVSFADPNLAMEGDRGTAEPMIVPAIPIRVQLEPQRRKWDLKPDRRYLLRQLKSSISLYATPATVLLETQRIGPRESDQNAFTVKNNASGSPPKLFSYWVAPIDQAEGRTHRGLVEFKLSEHAQERIRVRLDIHLGNELEYTSTSIASWDGGFSWHSLSPQSIRTVRDQLASSEVHIDHQLAQVKSSLAMAASTDERTLIRNLRKQLETNARLFETLDARLGELEKLVAIVELQGAFVLEVTAIATASGKDSAKAVDASPLTLFHSKLSPELSQGNAQQ